MSAASLTAPRQAAPAAAGAAALADAGQAIRRIIFTGDFLRPVEVDHRIGQNLAEFRPSQTENIAWFHRLFRRKLAEATGLPVEMKAWNQGIDTTRIYQLLGVERDTTGWVEAFSTHSVPPALLALMEEIFGDALVVAFEMADSMKQLLTHLRIPFIDFNMHPIRFLPDVFFAVQTNSAPVFAAMRDFHLPSQDYYHWADLLSATAVKLPRVTVPEQSLLLVGQTNVDRSLIIDGRLRNLSDYQDKLSRLVRPGQPVLFKPHPYNPGGFGIFESGLPYRSLRWTSDNIYALLAHPDLAAVAGVSSSVLAEARYFEKPATVLAALPFDIPDTAAEARPGQHLSLYDACFDTDFWRRILAPLMPVTRSDGREFRRPPHTLRISLRNFWGFNEVSSDFLVQVYEVSRRGR